MVPGDRGARCADPTFGELVTIFLDGPGILGDVPTTYSTPNGSTLHRPADAALRN